MKQNPVHVLAQETTVVKLADLPVNRRSGESRMSIQRIIRKINHYES